MLQEAGYGPTKPPRSRAIGVSGVVLLALGVLAPPAAAQTDPFLGVSPPAARPAPRPPTPRPAAPVAPGPASAPPVAAPTGWTVRCPAPGTTVTYSDGSLVRWQGGDPADPLTCIADERGGRQRYVAGVFNADGPLAGRVRQAMQDLTARGPGATARLFGSTVFGTMSDASYTFVLTFERLETIQGAWSSAGSPAALLTVRTTGSGNNYHQSVQRYWFDLRTGVVLRRAVELIAGSTTTRGREAVQVALPASAR